MNTTTSTEPEILEQTKESLTFLQKFWQGIDWDHLFSVILTKVIVIVLFTLLFLLLLRLSKSATKKIYTRYIKKQNQALPRAKTIRVLIENIFSYTLFFFYIYTILSVLGVPIGSLLAGAGIAGLAIGLGAQGFMNDIITGLFILLEQQMDVGDYIKLENIKIEGTVTSVGIRTTKILSKDGTLHFIPNRNITTIANQSRHHMQVLIDIPIFPTSDFETLHTLLTTVNETIWETEKQNIIEKPQIAGLIDLGNSQFVYRTVFYAKNGTQSQLKETFLTQQLETLKKADIAIPQWNTKLTK